MASTMWPSQQQQQQQYPSQEPSRAKSPLSAHHEHHQPRSVPSAGSPGSMSPRSPSSPLRYPPLLSASTASAQKPPEHHQSQSNSHPAKTSSGSCFVHSHLDNSLTDAIQKDAAARVSLQRKKGKAKAEDDDSTASEGFSGIGDNDDANDSDDEEEEEPSLTRQLAETAVSVREMSKQLGRARVTSHTQSVMIITKARDNHLIKLTRELALFLMQTPRNGRDRGLIVYVDHQLKKSKRFDAAGIEHDFPELSRPLARRYSRNSSYVSLANGSAGFEGKGRMTPMTALGNDHLSRRNSDSKRSDPEEGQLRYWTNEMCTKSPHLFDFVVTLGGDGTVLYASWLFQHIVPPVIPFALGSLGFLTNFDYQDYPKVLNSAIDKGIRVNLRMRFTCTVYRAVEDDVCVGPRRRAMRSGKTGGIYMSSLTQDGWEAIESGPGENRERASCSKKDKEIKCFSTRAVESFEVLNDLVVDRGPSPYVSLLELFGDEHHMTTVQADGICVSTPTGSTAYSLSAGGSLVHPEIPAILLTPICPHTLSFRPMLLPDSMELRICVPYNSRSTAWASFDGRGRVELRQGDHIKVKASQYPFPTVCADTQSVDWFESIGRTLKWNERQRQKSFVILEEGRKSARDRVADRKRAESAQVDPPLDGIAAKNLDDFGKRSPAELDRDVVAEEDEEEDEDDDDDDDGEYDIDDKSEAPTNASSPLTAASDTPATVPPMTTPSMLATHDRAMSSSSDLREDMTMRFHDPAPVPPRLSSRHSETGSFAVAPEITHHRLSASTARRRARGEEGDRDHIREPLETKRNVGGRPSKFDHGGHADRAFAVVGHDSDSESEAEM